MAKENKQCFYTFSSPAPDLRSKIVLMFCLLGDQKLLSLTSTDPLRQRIHPEWFVHDFVAFTFGQQQVFCAGGPNEISFGRIAHMWMHVIKEK